MTRILFAIHFLLVVDYTHAVYSTPMGNKIVKLDKFLGNCPNYNKKFSLIDLKNVTIRPNSTFDYDAVISKPIEDITLHLHFLRCSSKEALDTCMPLPVFKCRNICNFVESSTEFWSPAVLCARPHIVCPIRKAIYRGRHCSINLNAFTFFPLGSAYWKLRIVLIMNNREIFCTTAEGSIVR